MSHDLLGHFWDRKRTRKQEGEPLPLTFPTKHSSLQLSRRPVVIGIFPSPYPFLPLLSGAKRRITPETRRLKFLTSCRHNLPRIHYIQILILPKKKFITHWDSNPLHAEGKENGELFGLP